MTLLSNLSGETLEAGCDEAGRGCLAGPVVAAAVIFPKNYNNQYIKDSKKLSEAKRKLLAETIKNEALAFAIAQIDNNVIDEINILNSSILAMHKAIERLQIEPAYIIVDGNKFKPYKKTPHKCIVKGDDKFLSIAAASILAKTYRDEIMENLSAEFPFYNWSRNKGYPTLSHRKAIAEFGSCKYHRKTFRLLGE